MKLTKNEKKFKKDDLRWREMWSKKKKLGRVKHFFTQRKNISVSSTLFDGRRSGNMLVPL